MLKGILDRLARDRSGRREESRSEAQTPGDTIPARRPSADLLRLLTDRPLDPNLHLEYAAAVLHAGSPYLALAELSSARFLGAASDDLAELDRQLRASLPDPLLMSHNQYYRLATLAAEVRRIGGNGSLSILDVGGGDGRLAAFLPGTWYCLAEPAFNGISGLNLPFAHHAFDLVVSCHALEHIPADDRCAFLDQLLSKSKRGVVLLNPFEAEGIDSRARLRLFIDITGAQWARVHLDCSLPSLDHIRMFADRRRLRISIKPNGTPSTSIALVLLDHFAQKCGAYEDLAKINHFFNGKLIDVLDSKFLPNAYLVYLEPSETSGVLDQES